MNIRILAIILIFSSLAGMEQPRASKRPAQESVEQLKDEPKTPRAETEIEYPRTSLMGLPEELRLHIFNYLVSAQGATKQKQFYNATENIRKFLMGNKQLKPWLDDVNLAGQIITELAKRFTDNNVIEAAQALATNAASEWLAEQVRQKLIAQYDFHGFTGVRFLTGDEKFYVNLKDALFNAIAQDDMGRLRFLLHYRPQLVNQVISGTQPLLSAAVERKSVPMVRLLLKLGANVTPDTVELATEKDLDILKLVIAAGGNINQQTDIGSNLLVFAGNGQIASYLISHGVNVNQQNEEGFTPLYFAIQDDRSDVVKVLLDAGADANKIDNHGDALLHTAVIKNNPIIIKMLLDKGAYIEQPDAGGDTPLVRAVREYEVDAAATLLENGANAKGALRDASGAPASLLDYAIAMDIRNGIQDDRFALTKAFIKVAESRKNQTLGYQDIHFALATVKKIYEHTFEPTFKAKLKEFIEFLIEKGAKE